MITIVSGLARSGTSMVCRMLEAGGLPIVHIPGDGDEFNPHGYYEHPRVVGIWNGDASILDEADGRAIKVLAWVLPKIPLTYVGRLRVLFMVRPMKEILASWDRMHEGPERAWERDEREKFPEQLESAKEWLSRTHTPTLFLPYRLILDYPLMATWQIREFLALDHLLMEIAIDRSL